MRPIKFRAWTGKEMVPHHELGGILLGNLLNGKWSIMQFTGLHDKNGKVMWEGDLVQTKMDGKPIVCEVSYQDGYFCLLNTNPDDYRKYVGIMYGANPYGEVLGNINEHPELLKENT